MADSSFIDQSKLRFKEGEIVYRRGEMAQQMYVILSGKVRIYVGEEPKGDWVEELAKGDFFGEGSLLEAIARPATAVALEDSELIAINRGTFLRMIRQNPEVSVKMMQRLAQRNRELGIKVEKGEAAVATAVAAGAAAGAAASAAPAAKAKAAPPVQPAIVSVISGKKFPIQSHGALVGRFDPNTGIHPDIDLTEEDPNLSVSRRHARILCEHGRYFIIEEAGVANGTYVKGERLAPGDARELQSGDRVGFGMVVLFFEKG